MTDEPQRFFFVHVQKTAGTALFMRVQRHFPDSAIYPNSSDGDIVTVAPQLVPDQLVVRWHERRDEIRVINGHFPLCTVELLDAPFTTVTVLREPVERTLSYLRHHRKLTPADRDRSLEDIYDDPFRFRSMIHNHMVKMFSISAEEMTGGMLTEVEFTPDHLVRAKERLATVDHVGLQEQFEAFCEELTATYGWRLGEPLFANRTDAVEVSDDFRARIEQDNALDVELYRHAAAMVATRASGGSRAVS